MKRALRSLSSAFLFLSIFSVPPQSFAVSSNPSASCSGATCTVTFTYTGDYYQWSAPYAGTFTLEVWGAQGGDAGYGGTSLASGANGGYAKGNLTLTSGQVIYIYVGGKGLGLSSTALSAYIAGGWNGGGQGYNGNSTTDYRAGSGGGATDIRTGGTALSNRVIVAGAGGGGAYFTSYGTSVSGVGGGTSGGDGTTGTYGTNYSGKGGTSSAGGAKGNNCGCGGSSGTIGIGGDGESYAYGGAGGGGGYYGGGGAGTGMASGGGSGYVGGVTSTTLTAGNATMPNPSGGTMIGRAGDGIARITYDNSVNITNFVSSQSTPTNTSSAITFTFSTSQNVNSVANSDFGNSGTATGCSFSINAASGSSFTLTVSGCSEGTVIPKILANAFFGTVTSSNGPTSDSLATTSIAIDRTAPTISSVSAPANATYKPSDTPTFTMVFSESVTVTGTPRLTLTVGALTKYATYVSMTDSKTALFRYTVGTTVGEFDTDGIAVGTTLDLNGGAIADLATNALSPLTFTAPTLTSVLVSQPPSSPTIDSISATSGTLTVYFTAGASNGSAITNYLYSTDNGSTWKNRSSGGSTSPLVITTVSASATSLTNGTSYPVRIKALNAAGSGDSSTAVSATPSAVIVSGDATLVLTYGTSASTGTYTSTGGTAPYTYTLSSTPSGVSISSGVITVSSSTPAGTYTQNVVSTDAGSQSGVKQLIITVNKASSSISIALPNSATTAAASGTVVITATVSRAGTVNFKLGGSTISGCGAASAVATTATCNWTAPGTLGNVNLTADFTPSDASNYETATTTTLTINVVNGVSSVTLSLAGGVTQVPKGQSIVISAVIDQAGKLSFFVDGKRLTNCYNKTVAAGTRTCTWKPAVQKEVTITATLNPTNNVYQNSSASMRVWVVRRTNNR